MFRVEKEEEVRKFLEDEEESDQEDPLSVWTKMEPKFFNVPIKELKDVSVGEIWPEKKNILVVGNTSFSIPMQCAGHRREIYCSKIEKKVKLHAGK